jgi:phosphate starvation-inducible PhoH-like protein
MLEAEIIDRHMETGVIEVAPLAYMRGRTLNNAFIILDEAQNTTAEQMLMFLTRMGFNSKVVITGDPTQTDLPTSRISGLGEAVDALDDINDIGIVRLDDSDVVRHELVQKIIKAYRTSRSETRNQGAA